MNKKWSNTVLVAYSALPKIVKELDFSLARLVKSSFKSVHLKNGVSNLQLIGEIMEVNDEKRKIVNLRYIVSAALDKLTDTNRAILAGRIFKKQTFKELAQELDLSIRTLYRRFQDAEKEFDHHLKVAGYTEEWFEKEYGDDKYISHIHERLLQDKYLTTNNL